MPISDDGEKLRGMKRLLIISPYFPPSNAADMQRIRMSLPYFKQYGWDAEVVTVQQSYLDLPTDDLLTATIPGDIKVYTVKAFNKNWTQKLGFGSIAFRSYWFYRKKVDELLKEKKFDLIYFSTTQFPLCVLGAHWKKRFGVPYVIDMQDPWYSRYYYDKPKEERPAKFRFSYTLHKYLEPIAMKKVSGLISVSEGYIADLKDKYPIIKNIPSATITFGSFEPDLNIAIKNKDQFINLLDLDFKNIVYIGRGGVDMHKALAPVFKTLKQGLNEQPDLYKKLKLYFIGTSYAPQGAGSLTILPLAKQLGVENNVIELTDRIGYYHALATLKLADALFIPGSDDPKYTASKIYPYLLVKKPLLAVFNSKSSALTILKECGVSNAYSYDATAEIESKIIAFFNMTLSDIGDDLGYNEEYIEKYSAQNLTKKQCNLFNLVLSTINK